MRGTTTSWTVAGIGALVSAIGLIVGRTIGAAIAGFGFAHVILGVLDLFRPSVRK